MSNFDDATFDEQVSWTDCCVILKHKCCDTSGSIFMHLLSTLRRDLHEVEVEFASLQWWTNCSVILWARVCCDISGCILILRTVNLLEKIVGQIQRTKPRYCTDAVQSVQDLDQLIKCSWAGAAYLTTIFCTWPSFKGPPPPTHSDAVSSHLFSSHLLLCRRLQN